MPQARTVYESFRGESPEQIVAGVDDLLTPALEHDPLVKALKSTREMLGGRLEDMEVEKPRFSFLLAIALLDTIWKSIPPIEQEGIVKIELEEAN